MLTPRGTPLKAITVQPLCDHPDLIGLVAQWFVAEWPGWYGPGGAGDIGQDLQGFSRSAQALPVGLVVFEDGVPVGAGALKAESLPTHTHLSPWAAAGYVLPACRGRGIGAELLRALVAKAAELGYGHVYCGTGTAESLLSRSGWTAIELISHDGKPLTIFQVAV